MDEYRDRIGGRREKGLKRKDRWRRWGPELSRDQVNKY